MTYPRFPLPEDHMFGNTSHARHHRGEGDGPDGLRIASVQRRLKSAWGRKDVQPSGIYDGPTMEAVGAVQRAAGLPVNGWLDAETWPHIWATPADLPGRHMLP